MLGSDICADLKSKTVRMSLRNAPVPISFTLTTIDMTNGSVNEGWMLTITPHLYLPQIHKGKRADTVKGTFVNVFMPASDAPVSMSWRKWSTKYLSKS